MHVQYSTPAPMLIAAPEALQTFWALVDKTESCWLWRANRNSNGYGICSIAGSPFLAHRIAWELTNGPIPPGKFICHHCDMPPCVRPDHFFIGDHHLNTQDMLAKGRHCNGRRRDWRLQYRHLQAFDLTPRRRAPVIIPKPPRPSHTF